MVLGTLLRELYNGISMVHGGGEVACKWRWGEDPIQEAGLGDYGLQEQLEPLGNL